MWFIRRSRLSVGCVEYVLSADGSTASPGRRAVAGRGYVKEVS